MTSFLDDPGDISKDRRGLCWSGGFAKDRLPGFEEFENQYFCISLFKCEDGKAARRKGLFDACFVIVADDVREKLPVERCEMLPEPTQNQLQSGLPDP